MLCKNMTQSLHALTPDGTIFSTVCHPVFEFALTPAVVVLLH